MRQFLFSHSTSLRAVFLAIAFLADEQHSQYSKLLLASKEQVLHRVVLEEKVALEQQLAEEKHTPESCFIEAAIQEVKVSTLGMENQVPADPGD